MTGSMNARLVRAFFCLYFSVTTGITAAAAAAAHPVRIVVSGVADGSAAQQALLLAETMQIQTGQPFIVDHRSGIGGAAAAAVVARSAADGRVLLLADASLAVRAAAASAGAEAAVSRELHPVGQISATPLVLAVHPRVPARSLPELLALARTRDARIQAGTGMAGGLDHLAAALLLPSAVAARIAPFRGDARAVRQLIEGQIDLLFAAAPLALPQWAAGRMRLLAVTAASRNSGLARLPVLGKAQTEFVTSQWYALFMPAATAPSVVSAMQQSMHRALHDEAVTAYFEAHAVEAVGGDAAALEALLRRETERYASLIRRASMVP